MKTTPLTLQSRYSDEPQGLEGRPQPATGRADKIKGRGKKTAARPRHKAAGSDPNVNVGTVERFASIIGGGALLFYGLFRRSWGGALMAFGGGSLLLRGLSGKSPVYQALGISTAAKIGVQKGVKGIKIEKHVVIKKSPEELYQFWRNLENLPRFMNHLESVRIIDDKRSHWIAKAPAGTHVEWDAEIIREDEGHMLAWRSLENAEVKNAGSVYFERDPAEAGTKVRVILNYEPPAGRVGAAIAKLFGEEPSQQISEDLQRFKQLMEQVPYH